MGRRQDDYENGFLLEKEGRYVSAVIANGNPEKPVVYWTDSVSEAKAFRRVSAAEARARQLGARILLFKTEERGKGLRPARVILGEKVRITE